MRVTIILASALLSFALSSCNDSKKELYNVLTARLDSMHSEQNRCQHRISFSDAEHGRDSKESDSLRRYSDLVDSLHKEEVKLMIDKYGWLGTDKVAPDQSVMAFIFIQHSDKKAHRKYLPLLKEAVKNGTDLPEHQALLEDRLLVESCKKQIYGTQISMDTVSHLYYVLPTEDPDNLEKRRASVGLMPMNQYLSVWNIEWNAGQYKKDLPDLKFRSCTED